MNAKDNQPQAVDIVSDYSLRLDYDADNNLTYIGKAELNTSTSVAKWQIKKLSYTSSSLTSITWADGNESFDNIWDNRTSLTYL